MPPSPSVPVAEKEREVSAVATPMDRDSHSRDTRAWRSIPATDVQPLRYEATRFSTYREGTWCESGTAQRGMKEAGPLSHTLPLSDELCSAPPVSVVKVSGGSSSPPIPQRKTPPPPLIRPGSPVFTFAVQPGPRKQKKIRRVVGAILLHPSPNSTRGHQLASCLAPSPPLPIGKKNESLSLLPTTHLPPLRPCHRTTGRGRIKPGNRKNARRTIIWGRAAGPLFPSPRASQYLPAPSSPGEIWYGRNSPRFHVRVPRDQPHARGGTQYYALSSRWKGPPQRSTRTCFVITLSSPYIRTCPGSLAWSALLSSAPCPTDRDAPPAQHRVQQESHRASHRIASHHRVGRSVGA
ncbi:hypothetical protein PCL_07907 [Purpureocillium lilacinum]|uniref:Uncharacterized protein n=1 Tax=Purpureocillium lilacinum TaxID=33203 RepID=A0A2U3EJC8_PURLI|nr:hypothetical protein PCL_07907 [Purpureocillium lilacinum]